MILRNSANFENGGVYYYSERGDRLIDLDAFYEKLLQVMCSFLCVLVLFMISKIDLMFNEFFLLLRFHKN